MALNAVSLGLVLFAVIVIILGIVKIHTYPGKVAKARNHPQVEAIEVTSLLGLLAFPLWMAALVWAYSGAVIGVLYDQDKDSGNGASPDTGGPSSDANHNEAPTADPSPRGDG